MKQRNKHRQLREFDAEVLGDRRGWKRGQRNSVFANRDLGIYIHHVMWLSGNGAPQYDRGLLLAKGGAIVLLVDNKNRVGLIRKWQPQPQNPHRYREDFPNFKVEDLGRWSYEAVGEMPLGDEDIVQTIGRGIAEEAGLKEHEIISLGTFCSDPPQIANLDFYVLARVKRTKKSKAQDRREGISGLRFFTINQLSKLIDDGKLYDSRTLAALAAFWLMNHQKGH